MPLGYTQLKDDFEADAAAKQAAEEAAKNEKPAEVEEDEAA